jgi:hypothetical protein
MDAATVAAIVAEVNDGSVTEFECVGSVPLRNILLAAGVDLQAFLDKMGACPHLEAFRLHVSGLNEEDMGRVVDMLVAHTVQFFAASAVSSRPCAQILAHAMSSSLALEGQRQDLCSSRRRRRSSLCS